MSTFALCVGHSRVGDRGAINTRGVSEHAFNAPLAERVAELLRESGHKAHVIKSYDAVDYGTAMRWVANKVGRLRADAAVEFHFNSAGPSAEGYEYLFWGSSKRSEKLATCFLQAHRASYPRAVNRGILARNAKHNGAGFLRRTPCPAVILEPFFGSNAKETEIYSDSRELLASTYADALYAWASNKA